MPPPKKLCPECGEELYAVQMPGHRLREHGIEHVKSKFADGITPPDKPPAAPKPVPELPIVPEVVEDGETAPHKPKFFDRFRSRGGRGRGGQHQAPAPGERAPKRPTKSHKRRVPLDSDISDVWAFAGRRLAHGPHYPTGRMLEYQAPAAGVIFDRAVAGTLPDRVVFQPLARNRDKYEDVAFLLAGPLLTFSITTTGQRIEAAALAGDKEVYEDLVGKLEMQREMFTWVLSMMLPRLAEGAKLAREKKAKADAVIADAFPELGDQDPVDVLASMLFQPPGFEEAQHNGKPDNAPAPPRPEGAVSFGG
jgi:hypothetical protein